MQSHYSRRVQISFQVKNLLAFTAFLAAGFLLGSRRARKAGPIQVMSIEVKVDAKEALATLKKLEAQTVRLVCRGKELVAVLRTEGMREVVAGRRLDESQVIPMPCQADIDALQARLDAGESLTDAERATLYQYAKTS
jgi:hypothetical protein